MKKTRNYFVLVGEKQNVKVALNNIEFKGVTVIASDNITTKNIAEIFANNKSVVCSKLLPGILSPIKINVVNNGPSEDYCIDISLGDISGQFKSIADTFNCDIGDHKSNSSGLTGVPQKSDCAYCRYLNNQSTLPQRTLYSSKHFFCMPTLGEFIPGYWLIIPKEHVMSNAELDYSVQQELLDVIEDMSYLLNLTYGSSKFLVWENGTGNSGRGKAKDSVVHAHTHIAPSNLIPEKIQTISGLNFEKISTKDLSRFNLYSYLLLKDMDDIWWINSNPNIYIPRQYIRQILAEEYNIPGEQWNWREFPFLEQMMQSYYDMAYVIRKNWDILPDRIKSNVPQKVKDSLIK